MNARNVTSNLMKIARKGRRSGSDATTAGGGSTMTVQASLTCRWKTRNGCVDTAVDLSL